MIILVTIRNQETKTSKDLILFPSEDGLSKIEVRFADKNLWLTQAAMAQLVKIPYKFEKREKGK